jgi:hypothetical protein
VAKPKATENILLNLRDAEAIRDEMAALAAKPRRVEGYQGLLRVLFQAADAMIAAGYDWDEVVEIIEKRNIANFDPAEFQAKFTAYRGRTAKPAAEAPAAPARPAAPRTAAAKPPARPSAAKNGGPGTANVTTGTASTLSQDGAAFENVGAANPMDKSALTKV